MASVKRVLTALVAAVIVLATSPVRGADQTKPRVRAITGFITIDAKSYASQIRDAVTFLSRVRDAVTAAGYTVSGIRISTQPFPEYTRGLSPSDARAVLHGINDLAATLRFAPNIGPAMVTDTDDGKPADLLADILSEPGNRLNANIIVAADDGIHWNAVREAAHIIKAVGERSAHGQGNFNFGAIAMLKPYGPFYPGAWHPGGGSRSFAIGLEAANVVMDVFARDHDPRTAGQALTDALAVHARAVEAAAMQAAAGSDWTYAGIDPTPAPGGRVSIGAAIESFTDEPFGSAGTETAAAIITRAVKDVPVKQTGYSGLMIPVLEDAVLTRRWTERTYGLDSILAYSAVCAGGVDTVPLPGDTSEATLARIVGDVATLAFKWNKPLAARLLPAPGKRPGDSTEFSGALANATLQPLPGSSIAAASPAPARDPLVREGATVRVSPHVYVIPDDDVPLVPNVGIIVGSRATLVIDTGLGPRNGAAVVREVGKVSRNAELYLAVTHVHPEHDLGAQAFPASTRVLRSRGQDADIAEFGLQLAETFASQSPVRAELLKGATYRKTDISFDQSYALDLGGVRVQMLAVGPTHTRGDTVFFVEGDNTLFAGDVVMSAFPAFASPYSSVGTWLAALDRIDAMKPRVIVPSHGRLVDAAAITTYREYLRAVQSRTRALKAEGKSADDAGQIVQAELQTKYPGMAQPGRIAGAVKAAYVEGPYHVTHTYTLGGDGGWDYIVPDPPNHRLFIGRQNRVMVVDEDTGKLLGEVSGIQGAHGTAIAPATGHGFATSGRDQSVVMFDLKTFATLGRIPAAEDADAIIFDGASNRVFTFNGDAHSSTVIDPVAGSRITNLDLGGKPEYGASAGDGKVYANLTDTSEVVEIDAKRPAVTRRWLTAPCKQPVSMAIDTTHHRLFSGCRSGVMAISDYQNGKVVATVPIGSGVDGAGYDPASGDAFASNADGTLTIVHQDGPDQYRVVQTLQTAPAARNMGLDPTNHRVFLVSAKFGPTPAGGRGRGPVLPGSFTLLVVEREAAR